MLYGQQLACIQACDVLTHPAILTIVHTDKSVLWRKTAAAPDEMAKNKTIIFPAMTG